MGAFICKIWVYFCSLDLEMDLPAEGLIQSYFSNLTYMCWVSSLNPTYKGCFHQQPVRFNGYFMLFYLMRQIPVKR
jgi:hypothetical protein